MSRGSSLRKPGLRSTPGPAPAHAFPIQLAAVVVTWPGACRRAAAGTMVGRRAQAEDDRFMCGIFGYVGREPAAAQVVLEGLRKLEYRGYDSWGIAVQRDGRAALEKAIGKIGQAQTSLPPSAVGLGHTRWATHGGVTQENAHPHLDCSGRLAVIHNGIIENYQELRREVSVAGHELISDTDTE